MCVVHADSYFSFESNTSHSPAHRVQLLLHRAWRLHPIHGPRGKQRLPQSITPPRLRDCMSIHNEDTLCSISVRVHVLNDLLRDGARADSGRRRASGGGVGGGSGGGQHDMYWFQSGMHGRDAPSKLELDSVPLMKFIIRPLY